MFIRWMRWNRKFMNADTGAGSAGSGDPNTAGGNVGGTQDPNAGGQQSGGTKVQFTPEQQAAIDTIIAERVSRAQKSASKAALEAQAKELGFESVEAMQEALKAHRDAQEKEKTDLQKANEAKAAAEAKAKDAEERAKRALIKAAFAEAAIGANLVSADDAFLLADLSGVEVSDDGKVTGVKEAVEKLVEEKPYLVKQAGGSGGGGGGNPPRGNTSTDDPAERGRQAAMQRNQQQVQTSVGFDPWAPQGAAGGTDPNSIAQAVAAAVAAALQGQGNK